MTDEVTIYDYNDNEVKVGSRVMYFDDMPDHAPDPASDIGTVGEITDFDGDVDDDTGRSRMIPPDIKVKWDNGETESYTTSGWEFHPHSPDEDGEPTGMDATGKVEELIVVETKATP